MTSKLGLGTAALGRPHYINLRHGNQNICTLEEFRRQSLLVIEEAYNLGIRYFDTAPGYGMAEQLLLDWLKAKTIIPLRSQQNGDIHIPLTLIKMRKFMK